MAAFLDRILETTAADLEERRRRVGEEQLHAEMAEMRTGGPSRVFSEALSAAGVSMIAEFKRASPSKGPIRPDAEIASIVSAYERAGAAAISVLTEERHFGGSLEDLRQARRACGLPLLRKDFIIDGYQLLEASAAGADAVLLIAAALTDRRLTQLMAQAAGAGLECLVEVHDRGELERALAAGAEIIGINNRDLRTFEVDLETCIKLMELMPDDIIVVGESGIRDREDVSRLARSGIDAILVGETLMRSSDPEGMIRELLS